MGLLIFLFYAPSIFGDGNMGEEGSENYFFKKEMKKKMFWQYLQ